MRLNDVGATVVALYDSSSVRPSRQFCRDCGFTELDSKRYIRVRDQYGWWIKNFDGDWILEPLLDETKI